MKKQIKDKAFAISEAYTDAVRKLNQPISVIRVDEEFYKHLSQNKSIYVTKDDDNNLYFNGIQIVNGGSSDGTVIVISSELIYKIKDDE